MRFMVIVKADKNSEAGVMPSTELLTAMGKFNEEMVKAGVMLAGDGLHRSPKGVRRESLGTEADADRRPSCAGQGARFGLLDLGGADEGRGDRVGEALPESDAHRWGDRAP